MKTQHCLLPPGTCRTHRLQRGESMAVRAVAGSVWVTIEGDSRDIVLQAGQACRLRGPGLLAVQPLRGEAEIDLENEPEAEVSTVTTHSPRWSPTHDRPLRPCPLPRHLHQPATPR